MHLLWSASGDLLLVICWPAGIAFIRTAGYLHGDLQAIAPLSFTEFLLRIERGSSLGLVSPSLSKFISELTIERPIHQILSTFRVESTKLFRNRKAKKVQLFQKDFLKQKATFLKLTKLEQKSDSRPSMALFVLNGEHLANWCHRVSVRWPRTHCCQLAAESAHSTCTLSDRVTLKSL